MRNILTLLSAAALLSVPVSAQARGFESNFAQTITGPIKLEVIVSEDLAHRANNLPKNRSFRSSGSRINGSAFANNGKYGDKEIVFLLNDLTEELERDFAKRDIVISDTAPTILKVTIERVKPNRPTINQLSQDSTLSFNSFGIGGAEVTAEISSANGESLGRAEFDYFSSFLDGPITGRSSWFDTSRAFSRFSKRLSKKLSSAGASSS